MAFASMRGFSTAAAAEPLRKASGRGAGALSTFKEANNILDRWRNGPRQQRDGAYRQGPRRGANAGGQDFNNDWANDDEGNGNNSSERERKHAGRRYGATGKASPYASAGNQQEGADNGGGGGEESQMRKKRLEPLKSRGRVALPVGQRNELTQDDDGMGDVRERRVPRFDRSKRFDRSQPATPQVPTFTAALPRSAAFAALVGANGLGSEGAAFPEGLVISENENENKEHTMLQSKAMLEKNIRIPMDQMQIVLDAMERQVTKNIEGWTLNLEEDE